MQRIKNKKVLKNIRNFLIVLIAFSTLMTSLLSWTSAAQRVVNELSGEIEECSVNLLKLEKDAEGNITDKVIPNAEFYLYEVGTPDRQIGGQYTTDENGKIDVVLPIGDYYFVETHPSSSYTYDIDGNGEAITKYPFSVTKEDNRCKAVTVEAYNRKIVGSLAIEKTVRNENGEALSEEQLGLLFAFIVTFSDEGEYTYTVDGVEYLIRSGEALYLKHGQQAIFVDIPKDTLYTVEEVRVPGYSAQSTNHQGSITEDGKIVSFINTKTEEVEDTGSLIVTKRVTGLTVDTEKEFAFVVTINGVEHRFTLKDGESKHFENLPIGSKYKVEEEDYSSEGYVSMPSKYEGTIVDGETVLPFINHVDDGTKDPGELEIGKTVIAETIDIDKEFIFTVTLENIESLPTTIQVDGKAVEITTKEYSFGVILKAGEKIVIEDIPSGVTYKVEEQEEVNYVASITDVEGSIVSNQKIEIGFVNQEIPEPKEPEKTEIRVEKKVDGEKPETAESLTYEFVLQIEGEEDIHFTLNEGETKIFTDIPVGATYSIKEVNLPEGYALIEVLNGHGTVTQTGVHAIFTNRYVERILVEITGTKTWETNGHTPEIPEKITVYLKDGETIVEVIEIRPDENGEWKYTSIVPKYDSDGNEIEYTVEEEMMAEWKSNVDGMNITNTYIPAAVEEGISIEKRVIGDTPEKEAIFEFKMVGIDGAPMPEGVNESNNSKIIAIEGEGTNTFGQIVYSVAGSYEYRITELHKGDDGYTYDTTAYIVTIEVEERDGEYIVASKTMRIEENECEEIVFSNYYKEEIAKEKVIISGTKKWDHGGLESKYHPESITVIVRDGNRIVLERVITEMEQWRWSFVLNKYDAEGNEIKYTIDELSVPGYDKEIDGYNITNTYNPNSGDGNNGGNGGGSGSGTTGNKPGTTATGDSTDIRLLGIGLLLSASLIIMLSKKKQKQKMK